MNLKSEAPYFAFKNHHKATDRRYFSLILFTFHTLRECNFIDEVFFFILFLFHYSLNSFVFVHKKKEKINIKNKKKNKTKTKETNHWPLNNVETFF